MTGIGADRRLPWDWFDGQIPPNVEIADSAYVETSYSFLLYRSERPLGMSIGQGASAYKGTMFDVGEQGCVTLGDYVLVHGARIICDAQVTVEEYALISWNVVLMDTYRASIEPQRRRQEVELVPRRQPRRLEGGPGGRPVHVGRGAWIGFDVCVLPGVTVGAGAIVGARSVVTADVEPFTIVAGNPARLVRRLTEEEMTHGR